jgi:hypothetical protein
MKGHQPYSSVISYLELDQNEENKVQVSREELRKVSNWG